MRTKITRSNDGAVIVEHNDWYDDDKSESGRTQTTYFVGQDGRVRVRYHDGAERVYRLLRSTPEDLPGVVRRLRRSETDFVARRIDALHAQIYWRRRRGTTAV